MALKTDNMVMDYELRSEIARLREIALRTPVAGVPTMSLIDARSWADHTDDEDWLIWRARRVAERLKAMPIALLPGERVVGRPDLRSPTQEESKEIENVREILGSIPPYPGGDAGHFHPDFEKLFSVGIRGIREEIQERMAASTAEDKRTFYQACDIAIQGMTEYALRVAEECEKAASDSEDEADTSHWSEMARICRFVSTEPPSTFHEALQLMFFTIIAMWFGEDRNHKIGGRRTPSSLAASSRNRMLSAGKLPD